MNVPVNSQEGQAEDSINQPPPRYGEALLNGRKRHALNVEDVCSELNITPDIVQKIESSSTTGLPPATFMRGYLRAYARLVEIPVDPVLDDYARAVPAREDAELKARSNLPREANRHSPLVKTTTIMLVIGGVIAVIYGIYSYYSEKMQDFEQVAETADSSEQQPETQQQKIEIVQNARLTEDDVLIIEQPETPTVADITDLPDIAQTQAEVPAEPAAGVEQEAVIEEPVIVDDRLKILAGKDSWVEITDADNTRHYYNLLKQGDELDVAGKAPFSIFLGNAPEVSLTLNNVDFTVTNYIRSNNTAQFRVSTQDGQIIFHKR